MIVNNGVEEVDTNKKTVDEGDRDQLWNENELRSIRQEEKNLAVFSCFFHEQISIFSR